MRQKHNLRLHLLALVFYVAVAFVTLYPLVFNNGTLVPGFDYFNYHWNFWWIRHALTTPGLNVYETNFVFFPHMNNMGYHAFTAFWYPVWALIEPLAGTLTAMTVIIFLGSTLNGYLGFLFLRRAKAAPGLALLGGLALQATPLVRYFYYNNHINLMDWFWLPVQLLLWQQIVQAAETKHNPRLLLWAVVQGITLWGLGLTDHQFPIFVAFLLVPYGLYTLWRSPQRLRLLAAGLIVVSLGLALLWFAGPLPYMLRFKGTLAPGDVETRPGVPFPRGYFSLDPVWWFWNAPTMGAFVTLAMLVSFLAGLSPLRRHMPKDRWLWFMLLLPPLIFSMGATINLLGVTIPMPFRLLYRLTNGMFGQPWRLAPIYIFAAMVFVAKTWTPFFLRRPVFQLVVCISLMVFFTLDARLFEPAQTMRPVAIPYTFYRTIGQEQGEPYDRYVIVEVPTAVGTGETLIGDDRAIAFQFYALTHEKRLINGFISRAPTDSFWPLRTDDVLLSWLGQRRLLEPDAVEQQLRQRVFEWPIGYIVVHQDIIGREGPTPQEIVGYFNSLDDLLCPVWVEGDAVVYRTAWHPDGCPPRTPPEVEPGVYQIDIGSPGDEKYIGWGWHWPENISGLTLRWMGEFPATTIYVDLPPHAYELSLSTQAFWESRRLEVQVNGKRVGEPVTVAVEGLQQFTFAIPAEILGSGKHTTVTFAYDDVIVPTKVGQSADPRRLSVALDWIRFTALTHHTP